MDATPFYHHNLQLQLFFRNVSITLEKDISYTQGNELTIASYNVEGFFWIVRNIQYDIKKIVEENNIDILCIQEHCEDSEQDSIAVKGRFGLPYRCVFLTGKRHGPILGSAYIVIIP